MEIPLQLNQAQAGDIHQNNVVFIVAVDEEGNPIGALHKIQITSLKIIMWLFEKSIDQGVRLLVMPPGPAEFIGYGFVFDEERIKGDRYYYYKNDYTISWNPEQMHIEILNGDNVIFTGHVYSQWEFAVLLRQLQIPR